MAQPTEGAENALLNAILAIAHTLHDPSPSADWDMVLDEWAGEQTNIFISVLTHVQHEVDLRAFLSQLLRRIWNRWLGPDVKVVGPGSTEHRAGRPPFSSEYSCLKRAIECGRVHPDPSYKPDARNMKAWAHTIFTPNISTWFDSPDPPLPVASDTPDAQTVILDQLEISKNNNEDIDGAMLRMTSSFEHGITGLGVSFEARAYTFCFISRLYALSTTNPHSVLKPSPQTEKLIKDAHNLPTSAFSNSNWDIFLRQMTPMLQELTYSCSKQEIISEKHKDVINSTKRPRSLVLASQMSLPFWWFLVDASRPLNVANVEDIPSLLDILLYLQWPQTDDSIPFVIPGGKDIPTSSLIHVIRWILFACEEKHAAARKGGSHHNTNSKAIAKCLFAANPQDIDALISQSGSERLQFIWSTMAEPIARFIPRLMKEAQPSLSREASFNATCALLGALKMFPPGEKDEAKKEEEGADKKDDVLQSTLGLLVRSLALCGVHAQALHDSLLECDRDTANIVFAFFVKTLNPFLTAEHKELQKIYEKASYTDPQDIPPHLVDRFIMMATELASRHSELAFALNDAGLLTLLCSIRDGWYTYESIDDVLPREVRIMLRKRMVDEAFRVLSERTYIRAQARLLHEAKPEIMLTHRAEPVPRIRRRPSWMAAGG